MSCLIELLTLKMKFLGRKLNVTQFLQFFNNLMCIDIF